MFTGLVQSVGRVVEAAPSAPGKRLVVDVGGWSHRPQIGDSISVSGCCLTVAALMGESRAAFDVVPQTLARTTLGGVVAGSKVNLEHAVTAATLMGGHFVQGHVDGVGRVLEVKRGGEWRVRVEAPAEVGEFLTPRGSVAMEGVSLTVAELSEMWFEVALIPTTLAQTTLGDLKEGDGVNLEADMLAKMVLCWMKRVKWGNG